MSLTTTYLGLTLTSPTTFGQISGQSDTPRNMEFGMRVSF